MPAPHGIELPAPLPLSALVERFGGELIGQDSARLIDRLVSVSEDAPATSLGLLTHPRYLAAARRFPGVVLTNLRFASRLERAYCHPYPTWVLAELLQQAAGGADAWFPVETDDATDRGGALRYPGVHPTAVVHAGAEIHESVVIEPGAVIYPRVVMAAGVVIGAGSVVGREGFGWAAGASGVVRIPQRAGVVLEEDVELGPLCTIDAGSLRPTRIGRGSKLDAQVHVGHNVQIGPGCLIAAQCGFAGSCELGSDVRMGGQSGVADHIKVGSGAQIAAKTGVIQDVPAGEAVAGFPAVSRQRWLRAMARLFSRR